MNAKSLLTSKNVIILEALALAACLVMPAVFRSSLNTQADRVVNDLRTVRGAAMVAHARNGSWPAATPAGEVPESLRPFLPSGFDFKRGRYQIAWEHAELGPSQDPDDGPDFVGVSAVVPDGRLANAIIDRLKGHEPHFTVGDRTTLEIPSPRDDRP